MSLVTLAQDFNIAAQARKYGIPFWQHPQFLFLVMGILIIISMVASYLIGRRYIPDPHLAALAIIVLTFILLVVAFIITRSFERLTEASRLKSEFVSIVSHQLRSPLSNLKWAIEFLLSGRAGKAASSQAEYFQMLKENSSRMHDLVNDLLMVSRIDEGGLRMEPKAFSFPELLGGIIKEFEPYLAASNTKLAIEGGQDVPPVFADSFQVENALQNLLDNAIRYGRKERRASGEGKPAPGNITIRYKPRGKYLYFEIEDRGVGIPQEDQKYLFSKFFRSRNVLRHETQGSGLGLYITKSLIESAGGKLGFRSQEHKGSTFWLTIPFAS